MMSRKRVAETTVGLFIIVGLIALAFLALKVSGLSWQSMGNSYTIKASFDHIGDLKVRSPVTVAGVKVGQITDIHLNDKTYQAVVEMRIRKGVKIPMDSTANIYTEGLIGSNYISISPGFTDDFLKDGGELQRTNSAMILQNIIGQLMYSFKHDNGGSNNSSKNSSSQTGSNSQPVTPGSTQS